jgi:hypothetical protein
MVFVRETEEKQKRHGRGIASECTACFGKASLG